MAAHGRGLSHQPTDGGGNRPDRLPHTRGIFTPRKHPADTNLPAQAARRAKIRRWASAQGGFLRCLRAANFVDQHRHAPPPAAA